jgi:hypothetical protein
MLRVRARRLEVSYADYERYLENPTPEVRREMAAQATALRTGGCGAPCRQGGK